MDGLADLVLREPGRTLGRRRRIPRRQPARPSGNAHGGAHRYGIRSPGGFFYALAGTTASGLAGFALGRRLGRRQLDRLAGSRLHAASLRLRSAGVITVAALRMMPITHFTVVSLAAGVSHIPAREFFAGTLLGMAPSVGAIAIFFEQFSAMAQDPGLEQLLWLTGVSCAILAVLLYFRRLARNR